MEDNTQEQLSPKTWFFGSILASFLVYNALRIFNFFRKYNNLRKKTEKIPGPKGSYILGNMMDMLTAIRPRANLPSGPFVLEYMCGLAEVYREHSMYRFWYPFSHTVLLINAKTVEPLLTSNTAIEKSIDYKFLERWLGLGLITSSGLKWKKRRKMLTPSFHFRILEEFQPIISEQSNVLIQIISELPKLYCPNVLELITLTTLDVICETALGFSIDAQKQRNDSAYAKAIKELGTNMGYRAMRPWLWNDLIYSFTDYGKQWEEGLRVVHEFTEKVIKERKGLFRKGQESDGKSGRKLAFLDLLLEEQLRDPSFTDKDIQEEVDTFTFAGHDTTSSGITWCLYMIGLYPDVQVKVQKELDEIFGEDRNGTITTEHVKCMKYLDRVIKEIHRLYPPVPVIARELKEDMIIDGRLIPAETTCYVNMSVLHRDPEVFPNPEVFDPDRFLPENTNARNPFAYLPFSAGPRNCIGQRFAGSEEKTVLANVLRNFNLKSLDHRDKIVVSPDIVSRPTPDIRIQFQKRSNI